MMSIVILSIVLLSILAIIPYIVTLILKFALWKFSFTARVNGFLSFKDIMLRIPLHLDFSVVIRIESVSISFKIIQKIAKISLVGFQINILVRNELEQWTTRKIELLQMLEDIRTSLKRKGELKPSILSLNRQNQSSINEQITMMNASESAQIRGGNNDLNHQKTFMEKVLNKLLNSFEVEAQDTAISFYVYKDEEKIIEEANVKKFHQQYLQSQAFREKNLCFRVFIAQAKLNVKSMNDEEMELLIQSDCVRVQNPANLHKQGTLSNVQVIVKVPLDKKLAKDFCNFELRINIQNGLVNFNNKFLKKMIKFFVYMDTLKAILKRVKKLILKLHYQEEMLNEMEERKILDLNGGPQYENVRDVDIPKRLQIVIQEGLTVILTDSNQKLKPFLSQSTTEKQYSQQQQQQQQQQLFFAELSCVKFNQVTFELLRTLKNSYYMTVQSEKVLLECNQQETAVIHNFVEELDFSDKKQITGAPIREVKTDIINTIKAESVQLNITKPFTKLLLDIVSVYKKMVHIASVKHKVMRIILDKDFLTTNLLHLGSQNKETEKEKKIFELFREKKHQDFLVNEIKLDKVIGQISSWDQNTVIDIDIQDFTNKLKAEKGIDELITKMSKVNIQPQKQKSLSILKLENFENITVTAIGQEINQDYITLSFDKGQFNANVEILMEMSKDLIDFNFIFKNYTKQWSNQYAIKENKKLTILESLTIQFKEAQLIAQISKTRNLAFRLVDFKTNSIKRSFSKNDVVSMSYSSKKVSMFFTKMIKDQMVPGQVFCLQNEERQVQNIIDLDVVEFRMVINQATVKIQIFSQALDFSLPYELQFGALIYELIKQSTVATEWFKLEYKSTKKKNNFKYSSPNSNSSNITRKTSFQQKQTQQNKTSRAFLLEIDVDSGVIKAEEAALKEVFVNKNEIIETLQERELYKCKPSLILKLLKRLKLSKLNANQTIIQAKKFKMVYEIPQFFTEFQNVFTVIQKLDEAKKTMTPSLFSDFGSAIHTYTAEYVSYHIRNLQKPLVEAWNVEMKFLIVTGTLNPDQNPSLFKTKIKEKIFNKYEVTHNFNKLESKIYYNSELKCDKFRFNVQGQQSILCLSDFAEVYTKFNYEDMSKSRDIKKQKLNYYSGLDSMRNRFHGKLKVDLQTVEILVYPKRKFNRYDSYMQIGINDLKYYQHFMCQEISMRNFVASKYPLKQFESATIKIPLLELQLYMLYNQGKSLNHFTHNGAKSIGQYLDQLKAYSSQEVQLDCKLNIPSLGYINPVDQQNQVLKDLLNNYVEKSPVPLIHYQRSHMRFFDQLYKEYILKKDHSGPVLRRKAVGGGPKIKNKRQHLFGVKIKTLITDLMMVFTDYKERDGDFTDDSPLKQNEDIQQKKLRDRHLQKYQGLMFTNENLCFNSQINVRKVKDGNSVELKNSCLSGFKHLRDSQFDSSMDNYKKFCQFFEINSNIQEKAELLQYNSVLSSFKTLFPQNLVKNIQLQNDIILSTLNNNLKNPYSSDDFRTTLDEFIFTNQDTIAILVSMTYKQDQEVMFKHISNDKKEAWHFNQQHHKNQANQLILEQPMPQPEEEKLLVKHLIDIKGFRLLYTKITKEHITHHLIKGFSYSQFRKTDFIDIDAQKDSRDFLNEYEYTYAGRQKKSANNNNSGQNKSGSNPGQSTGDTQMINLKQLKKTALIAIRLDDPQINFQNELTYSQMLLTPAKPSLAAIFAYSKNTNIPVVSGLGLNYDDLSRCKSGYTINSQEEIVRYELSIELEEMDLYVAPTIINLDNPTFFVVQQNDGRSPDSNNEANSYRSRVSNDKELKKENLMRKIFTMNNIAFTFDFLNEEFVDYLNSQMSIDIFVEKLNSEMDGPSMWHFVNVLKSILFDRGEKAEEVIIIEQKRNEELQSMKLDIIKSIIDQKLKRTFLSQGADCKPSISKKVSYTILNGQFSLHNFDTTFAQVVVSKAKGTHQIYANREARADIDIDKILIENYADSEEYRMVLFPGYSFNPLENSQNQQVIQDTMIKIRARDKFVVVKQAPWKVFDQFEVFIFPTSVQLTKNFYNHIKRFFFSEVNISNVNKMEEEQKYELLVPTKILQKAQKQKKLVSKNTQDPKKNNDSLFNADRQSERNDTTQESRRLFGKLDFVNENEIMIQMRDDDESINNYSPTKDKDKIDDNQAVQDFPIFFRYMRMNEISVSITYYHNKNSFFNTKDIKIKLAPFIKHGKFMTFQKIFEQYAGHCKKKFISQIPSLIKQKLLQTREKLDGFNKNAKGNNDIDDDYEDQQEVKKELKLHNAKKIIFGEFYN